MTTTRAAKGGVIHFPAAIILDSVSVIEPPPSETLPGIAEAVHPAELLIFSKRLVQAARKRNRNVRWQKVNRSRIELARLCLERALSNWSAAMPPLPDPQNSEMDEADNGRAYGEAEKKDLVGEAFHTFGETAAQALADKLDIPFEDCAEAIERLKHRPH